MADPLCPAARLSMDRRSSLPRPVDFHRARRGAQKPAQPTSGWPPPSRWSHPRSRRRATTASSDPTPIRRLSMPPQRGRWSPNRRRPQPRQHPPRRLGGEQRFRAPHQRQPRTCRWRRAAPHRRPPRCVRRPEPGSTTRGRLEPVLIPKNHACRLLHLANRRGASRVVVTIRSHSWTCRQILMNRSRMCPAVNQCHPGTWLTAMWASCSAARADPAEWPPAPSRGPMNLTTQMNRQSLMCPRKQRPEGAPRLHRRRVPRPTRQPGLHRSRGPPSRAAVPPPQQTRPAAPERPDQTVVDVV